MDNKTNILNCSLTLFSQKGFEAVSVQQLVNEANITKPTLYYYFKSKEGLYNQLLEQNYTVLNNKIEKISKYSPNPDSYHEDIYPVLERIINTYFSFAKENPEFYRIVLTNQYMPKSSSIYNMSEKLDKVQYQIILETFNDIANTHTNLKKNVTKLTYSFIGLINTYIGLFLQDDSFELSTTLSQELVHQFMHGIHA